MVRMASWQFELCDPPTEPRARELWLQHAAGFILVEDVRQYAIEQLGDGLDPATRATAIKGIDAALYGVMMVADGVTGALRKGERLVSVHVSVRLEDAGRTEQELDLFDGDGACMGYHGWVKGEFGDDPVARPPPH
jgi:hypothetical protein